MSELAIVAVNSSVMLYDDSNKKWIHCGTSPGISRVQVYHHSAHNTFRIVGRKIQGHEVVLNCSILKNMKYNIATPTFHQWRDNRQVYGLNFGSLEEAETFSSTVFSALNNLAGTANSNPTLANSLPHENGYQGSAGHHCRNQSVGSASQYAAPSQEVGPYNGSMAGYNGDDMATYQKIEYQQRLYGTRDMNGWCESNKKYAPASGNHETNNIIANGTVHGASPYQQHQANNADGSHTNNSSSNPKYNSLSPNPPTQQNQGSSGLYTLSPYQAALQQQAAAAYANHNSHASPKLRRNPSATPLEEPTHYQLLNGAQSYVSPGGSHTGYGPDDIGLGGSNGINGRSLYHNGPDCVSGLNLSTNSDGGCPIAMTRSQIPPPPPLPKYGESSNSLAAGLANIKLKKATTATTSGRSPSMSSQNGACNSILPTAAQSASIPNAAMPPPPSTTSQMMQEMMATLARRKARLRNQELTTIDTAASSCFPTDPTAPDTNNAKANQAAAPIPLETVAGLGPPKPKTNSGQSSTGPVQQTSSMSSAASSSSFSSIQSVDSAGPGAVSETLPCGPPNNNAMGSFNTLTATTTFINGQAAANTVANSPIVKKKSDAKPTAIQLQDQTVWDCLKQEILQEIRKEFHTLKQDIISGIMTELRKR